MSAPVLLLRKKRILNLLDKAGAYSEESAKSLSEIGLFNPNAFPGITKRLVKNQIIKQTANGKYYINR